MEQNICKLPPGAWDSHVHIVDVSISHDRKERKKERDQVRRASKVLKLFE
jgi:hypothetical protein